MISVVGVFFGIIFWQHFGRIHQWSVRPSVLLDYVADSFEYVWKSMGRLLAWFCSYYHFLYFYSKELVTSICDIFIPIGRILASPIYLGKGFIYATYTYAKPHLILWGSFLITLGIWLFLVMNYEMEEKLEYKVGLVLFMIFMNWQVFTSPEILKTINDTLNAPPFQFPSSVYEPPKKPTRRSNRKSNIVTKCNNSVLNNNPDNLDITYD